MGKKRRVLTFEIGGKFCEKSRKFNVIAKISCFLRKLSAQNQIIGILIAEVNRTPVYNTIMAPVCDVIEAPVHGVNRVTSKKFKFSMIFVKCYSTVTISPYFEGTIRCAHPLADVSTCIFLHVFNGYLLSQEIYCIGKLGIVQIFGGRFGNTVKVRKFPMKILNFLHATFFKTAWKVHDPLRIGSYHTVCQIDLRAINELQASLLRHFCRDLCVNFFRCYQKKSKFSC